MNKILAVLFSIISLPIFASDSTFTTLSLVQQFSTIELVWMGITVCLLIFFLIRFDKFAVTYGPEVLTTMGIAGCFGCIAVALLQFNSVNITESIPSLLNGIKTAFCLSFIGVIGALSIRVRHKFSKKPLNQTSGEVMSSTSMDNLLKEIVTLRKIWGGDEEGSLLSQVKMLRQDSHDQQTDLRKSFDSFATHMVENNQQAFIEALRQAITDFNNNLTEQFGENFKNLNESVGGLVVWQEQYKEELETIKKYQSQFSNDMAQSSKAFSSIVENAAKFSDIAQDLKILLELMNTQIEVVFNQEKALSELLSTMKNHIPDFSNNAKKMISEISDGVSLVQSETVKIISDYKSEMKVANNEINSLLTEVVKNTHDSFSSGIKDNLKALQELSNSLKSETSEIIKNHGTQLQSTQAEMKNVLVDNMSKYQQKVSSGLEENLETIRKGVMALDTELEKALTDSLTSLGKQLASLSEKFVSDYTPLTDRLRELVRLAKVTEGNY